MRFSANFEPLWVWGRAGTDRNHPHQHFGQLTRTILWVFPLRKLGAWSEFPFLYRFTVLLNSGGSNSPWSEFWSEFPQFMGMGVVPAPSTKGTSNKPVLCSVGHDAASTADCVQSAAASRWTGWGWGMWKTASEDGPRHVKPAIKLTWTMSSLLSFSRLTWVHTRHSFFVVHKELDICFWSGTPLWPQCASVCVLLSEQHFEHKERSLSVCNLQVVFLLSRTFTSCTRSLCLCSLAGLETQTQNAAFLERKRPKRKPWHRGKCLNRKKRSQCVFWTLAFYYARP